GHVYSTYAHSRSPSRGPDRSGTPFALGSLGPLRPARGGGDALLQDPGAMPFPDGGKKLLLGRARTGRSGRVAWNSGSSGRLRAGQADAAGVHRSSQGRSFLGLRRGAGRSLVVPPGSRSVGPSVPP